MNPKSHEWSDFGTRSWTARIFLKFVALGVLGFDRRGCVGMCRGIWFFSGGSLVRLALCHAMPDVAHAIIMRRRLYGTTYSSWSSMYFWRLLALSMRVDSVHIPGAVRHILAC